MEFENLMTPKEMECLERFKSWGLTKEMVEVLSGIKECSYDILINSLRIASGIAIATMGKKWGKGLLEVLSFVYKNAEKNAQVHEAMFKQTKQSDAFKKHVALMQVKDVLEKVCEVINTKKKLVYFRGSKLIKAKQCYIQQVIDDLAQDSVDFELAVVNEKLSDKWSEYAKEQAIKTEVKRHALEVLEKLLENDDVYAGFSRELKDIKEAYAQEGLEDAVSVATRRSQGENHEKLLEEFERTRSYKWEVQQGQEEAVLSKKWSHLKKNYGMFMAQAGFGGDMSDNKVDEDRIAQNSKSDDELERL